MDRSGRYTGIDLLGGLAATSYFPRTRSRSSLDASITRIRFLGEDKTMLQGYGQT